MKYPKPKEDIECLCHYSFQGNFPESDASNPHIYFWYPNGKEGICHKIDTTGARENITAAVGEVVIWDLDVLFDNVTILPRKTSPT